MGGGNLKRDASDSAGKSYTGGSNNESSDRQAPQGGDHVSAGSLQVSGDSASLSADNSGSGGSPVGLRRGSGAVTSEGLSSPASNVGAYCVLANSPSNCSNDHRVSSLSGEMKFCSVSGSSLADNKRHQPSADSEVPIHRVHGSQNVSRPLSGGHDLTLRPYSEINFPPLTMTGSSEVSFAPLVRQNVCAGVDNYSRRCTTPSSMVSHPRAVETQTPIERYLPVPGSYYCSLPSPANISTCSPLVSESGGMSRVPSAPVPDDRGIAQDNVIRAIRSSLMYNNFTLSILGLPIKLKLEGGCELDTGKSKIACQTWPQGENIDIRIRPIRSPEEERVININIVGDDNSTCFGQVGVVFNQVSDEMSQRGNVRVSCAGRDNEGILNFVMPLNIGSTYAAVPPSSPIFQSRDSGSDTTPGGSDYLPYSFCLVLGHQRSGADTRTFVALHGSRDSECIGIKINHSSELSTYRAINISVGNYDWSPAFGSVRVTFFGAGANDCFDHSAEALQEGKVEIFCPGRSHDGGMDSLRFTIPVDACRSTNDNGRPDATLDVVTTTANSSVVTMTTSSS